MFVVADIQMIQLISRFSYSVKVYIDRDAQSYIAILSVFGNGGQNFATSYSPDPPLKFSMYRNFTESTDGSRRYINRKLLKFHILRSVSQ